MDYFQPSAKEWEEDLKEIRVRLLGAGLLLVGVTLVGTIGFRLIDPSAGWVRAFFMTAITLTTVGFGEEVPVDTDGARIFTAVLILVGMGVLLYFVSTGTAFVLEGQLSHVFRRRRMERDLAELTSHVIVCGSGPTAVYAARELVSVQRPVVMVVSEGETATELRDELGDVPIVLGDPTDEETLVAAGVERAAGVVACTGSDNENVVVTLTARQVNPSVRIVSQVEIRIPEGSPAIGKRLNDLGLGQLPGILLVATRTATGEWKYNPSRTQVVSAGTVLIFLGSPEESRQLCEQLGGEMIATPATG